MTKPKPCKAEGCQETFLPRNSTQKACSYPCALKIVEQKKKKQFTVETARMKRKFLAGDRKHQTKLAVTACHTYIKLRDKDLPCISCGTYSGKMNAGHYLSAGRMPELKFHWANINKQCEYCNNHLSGNAARYRINLVEKIGLPMVEFLEGPQTTQKRTLDDFKDMQEWFKDLSANLAPSDAT